MEGKGGEGTGVEGVKGQNRSGRQGRKEEERWCGRRGEGTSDIKSRIGEDRW